MLYYEVLKLGLYADGVPFFFFQLACVAAMLDL